MLRAETHHAKTLDFVVSERGVVPQYITQTLCFRQDSQQGGKLDGICSTSCSSTKPPNPNSLGMSCCFAVLRFRVLDGFKAWV